MCAVKKVLHQWNKSRCSILNTWNVSRDLAARHLNNGTIWLHCSMQLCIHYFNEHYKWTAWWMAGGPDSRLEMAADRLTDRQTTGLTDLWVITYICADIAVVWGNDRRDNKRLRSLISNVIRILATCDVLNETQSTLSVTACACNNSSHMIYFVHNTINFHREPC